MNSNIIAHCIVRSKTVILDGKIIYQESNNAENLETFLTNVYRHWGISYPKFFKMDILSKLAFITAEKMLENRSFCGSDMALVLSNNSSSIMSDIHHQKSIQKPESYFPSPAVEVGRECHKSAGAHRGNAVAHWRCALVAAHSCECVRSAEESIY